MNYLESLKSMLAAEANQRLYTAIPNDHVWPAIEDGTFTPDECYLRIWLSDMYLAHKRVLYQTRFPLVHATCRFQYRGKEEELPLVVGSRQSAGLTAALDRVVDLNYRLIGPVPFRGGEVEVLIALMAMEAADYGDQLLDMLGMLSQITGRSELQVALPFIQTLKHGVDGLFGLKNMQNMQLHLGIHDTFTAADNSPSRLTLGYRVVMDVIGNRIDPATLWVKNGRLCQGPALEAAVPFQGMDYFVFFIERMDSRDDRASMPSILPAWDAAIAKAGERNGNDQDLDMAFATFKGVVLTSPDLIWNDQVDLLRRLDEKVRMIRMIPPDRRGFVGSQLDTSLAGALAEPLPPVGGLSSLPAHPSREEVISLTWR